MKSMEHDLGYVDGGFFSVSSDIKHTLKLYEDIFKIKK